MSTVLDHDFLKHLAAIHDHAPGHQPPRLKWYLTTIIAFGGMNYPELIPELYQILLREHIHEEEQMQETRKIREGLTKICGIWGAAKTGSATRQLSKATPPRLKDPTVYRSREPQEVAFKRGQEMLDQIYKRIPGYDMSLVSEASPDYGWIVNNLFYGHVFSFPDILDAVETGQCVVAALFSTDCQEQVRNHMLGMMYSGATRGEVEGIRAVVMAVADKLGVVGKQGRRAIEVPEM
ncbi:hypothetical protein PV08_03489 [Exophiala spinifera]|uniref:Carboxymuconolactone decarboxylase-like domain-containing protein n=1 Tax=Exophiala spinifera TaxID=91928 RepID=A0A0D2BKR9_9EURO|nr:uncharacterized protein PV08_03489 [Exophiala spinifera]KIW19195.1 hypothetical protein PV08_03489 [Exophiala spinifera]